ncbi:MAG: dynamin [Microcoleus sp. SU_5_3]|nr:dynamin [Microcoleus sp. SU_5_3]
MSSQEKAAGWLNNLDRLVRVRNEIATLLEAIAQNLTKAESQAENTSGKLGLSQEIERLIQQSENLRQGVFRFLVLGDMKRGKSTFLNALLGQNLLPSDVTPCTALLTVLKYGTTEKVTIYYNDNKQPEELDFQQFKQRYTIDVEEAKILEGVKRLAFPDISHAVVEHPLPLLAKGIEFVDSPGLNDTEARNQLTLDYIYNCHAILFVLSASQPCTLDERRYLQNYLKDRGLTIFFIVNGWDRVRDGIVDPEDTEELQLAEEKLRQVLQANLAEYCQDRGRDIYQKRVFELSALNALRTRLKNSEATLEGTGFVEFLASLNHFLTGERAAAEREQARSIALQACNRFQGAISRRIPLLDETVDQLKNKIDSIQSEFASLSEIGNQFQQEIRTVRDRNVQEISDSFRTYILDLENTFEEDFLSNQPDLDFMQFLDKNNRGMFYGSFKLAFERYMNDRLSAWEFIAKQKIASAFSELEEKAVDFRIEYEQVVETMNKKLLGYRFYAVGHSYKPEEISTWAEVVIDMFSFIPDKLNRGIYSFSMFWQSVLSCVMVTLVLNIIRVIFASLTLSVLGGILVFAGAVALQAEYVRQQFISTTKKEFVKHLPQIADEQSQYICEAVRKCFDTYEEQVYDRVTADINSRKAELDSLLVQKQFREIDIQAETKRLKDLEVDILSQLQQIEFLGGFL